MFKLIHKIFDMNEFALTFEDWKTKLLKGK